MKAAMWSSFFVDLSPEEMVDAFAEKRWTASELSCEHAEELLKRGDPAREGEAFRRYAEGRGVAFPQGHLWITCDIVSDDQDARIEVLKPWLDLFAAIGARAAVLHPGGHAWTKEGRDPAHIADVRGRGLRIVGERAAALGLEVCIENCPPVGGTAGEIRGFIEDAGSEGLAICLDTGHLNLIDGSPGAFIREAGALLKALHIADNQGKTDQHLIPYGCGTVPWHEVGPALREIGYDGLFNFEVPGERRCPLPARFAKLDYLEAVLPVLLSGEPFGGP